jgi:lipopolysaccharide biosynthesis protein
MTALRTIAFYLPQFHRIPENDAWWGEGFTEWTNVRRASRCSPATRSRACPASSATTTSTTPAWPSGRRALARSHGVTGFCYYFYWFNGRRLLERPLEAMLARGTPDYPFCVCWPTRTGAAAGTGRQRPADGAALRSRRRPALFGAFLRLFADPRYLRVDGRPLLSSTSRS